MARSWKQKICPFLSGSKQGALHAIRKLNEVTVLLVAVFVLLEFRNIPLQCSNYGLCLNAFIAAGGEASDDIWFENCGGLRAKCMENLLKNKKEWKEFGEFDDFNTAFDLRTKLCICLIKENSQDEIASIGFTNLERSSVNLGAEPLPYCSTEIGPILIVIFTFGACVIVIGECVLPRRSSSVIVLIAALLFYIATFSIVLGLKKSCPGRQYQDNLFILSYLCLAAFLLGVVAVGYVYLISKDKCPSVISYGYAGELKRQKSEKFANDNVGDVEIKMDAVDNKMT